MAMSAARQAVDVVCVSPAWPARRAPPGRRRRSAPAGSAHRPGPARRRPTACATAPTSCGKATPRPSPARRLTLHAQQHGVGVDGVFDLGAQDEHAQALFHRLGQVRRHQQAVMPSRRQIRKLASMRPWRWNSWNTGRVVHRLRAHRWTAGLAKSLARLLRKIQYGKFVQLTNWRICQRQGNRAGGSGAHDGLLIQDGKTGESDRHRGKWRGFKRTQTANKKPCSAGFYCSKNAQQSGSQGLDLGGQAALVARSLVLITQLSCRRCGRSRRRKT